MDSSNRTPEESISELDNCGDFVLKIDEAINVDVTTTENTVELPTVENLVIEDYDDYEDDHEPSEITKLKIGGLNLLQKSLKLIMKNKPRGEIVTPKRTVCDRRILRESADNLDNKVFDVENATVKTSAFEYTKSKLIDTIVMSCNRSFLDPDSISSNIISVSHFGKQGEILKGGPFVIEFVLHSENETFRSYNYFISSYYLGWVASVIDYEYNVHRINVVGGKSCLVKFYNMTDADKFMIVFTTNIRPTYRDFKGAIDVIHVGNPIVNCRTEELQNIDRFVYMGILPHKDMIAKMPNQGKVNVAYHIKIFQQACYAFDEKMYRWGNSSCKPRYLTDREKPTLECSCNHTTYFAASMKEVDSRVDIVYVIKYKTHFLWNYVIFGHVFFVLLCYLIALSLLRFRATTTSFGRDNVVYLSDNRKNDRYAYFLIVKTGSFPFSGTTSNVTIKLYGERDETLAHVLNYPDPNKRFLQRDRTDWFILTNNTYLGHISMIEIWIDSIGYRPSWYCETITLLDLQTNMQLLFKVNKWLSVMEGSYFVATTIISSIDKKKEGFVTNVRKNCRFHKGAENTWNILSRTEDDYLTYSQRITIILSMIYTTYVMNILLTDMPELEQSDAYGRGKYTYEHYMLLHALYASMISSGINLPFVYFFRNSCKRKKTHSLILEDEIFGLKATKILWCFLSGWIVACIIYLVISGFWVPYNNVLVWRVCTIFSILFSVFIIENMFILLIKLLTIYFVKVKAKIYNIVQLLAEIERQRKTLYKKFGEMLMRPYFRKHYNKMPYEVYIRKKNQEMERSRITDLFKSMCVYLIFLFSLYCLIFIDNNSIKYNSNKIYHNMLAGDFLRADYKLDEMDQNPDIIKYLNYTLHHVIHAGEFYEGFKLNDPGLMADYNSKVLGVARIRQQRRNQTCTIPDDLDDLPVRCYNTELNISNEVQLIPSVNEYDYLGILKIYQDGGYVTHLGRTPKNTKYMIKLIEKNKWIDLNTYVIFIEFLAYNPNCNLFNSIRVNIERDISGHLVTSTHIVSFQIVSPLDREILLMFFVTLFIIGLSLMTANLLVLLLKWKLRFFRNIWHFLEFMTVVLAINITLIYFERKNSIRHVLKMLLDANNNEFVNYSQINHLSEWLQIHLGFLGFFATLNFWKYLRFGYIFRLMERSLHITVVPLLSMIVGQLYLFMMFCIFYYLTVGNFIWPFWCVSRSITTIVLISLNFMKGYDRGELIAFGELYSVAFMAFMLISVICFNMYSTILMVGFIESKEYFSNKEQPYTLKSFLHDEITFKKKVIKAESDLFRLKAGGDDEDESVRFVTPKEPAKRYANCLLMTDEKLDLMKFVAISVMKGLERMKSEYDLLDFDLLLVNVLKRLKFVDSVPKTDKLQQNVFFRGKDPITGSIRFVNNLRLLQMEYALEEMLHPSVKSEEIFKPDILHMTGDSKRLKNHRDTMLAINRVIQNIDIQIK